MNSGGHVKDLREAPLVDEEYSGPVLFSANAAATVFAISWANACLA